jgi:hypothetical protein
MSRKQTMDLVDQPVDPDAKRAYRETIARAKARGRRERPGPMEGTPNFDDIQEPRMTVDAVRGPQKPQEQGLSPDTEAGLKALAAAQRKPVPQEPAAEVEASEDAAAEPESRELTNEEESDAIRETIEARVEEFDIGQYILSGGEMTQTVPIIPGKLEVTFRTATDYEEWYVDNQLAKDRDITARQYVRRTNEWGLAMHISSLAGDKWPSSRTGTSTKRPFRSGFGKCGSSPLRSSTFSPRTSCGSWTVSPRRCLSRCWEMAENSSGVGEGQRLLREVVLSAQARVPGGGPLLGRLEGTREDRSRQRQGPGTGGTWRRRSR